jgi:serine/threonine protein kinase
MPPTVDASKGSVNQATSEVAPGFCIGDKYRLRNVVHVDSKTYVGTNTLTGENVAVKLESVHTEHPHVEYETSVYQELAGGIGIPAIHWSGLQGDFHVMVSDLLGPNLEEVFNTLNRRFSLKTVLLLADQLISRIEYIHGKSFLHRCIGPESFYLGRGILTDRVNVANFSLAKRYSSSTGRHIPYVENMPFGGIARYASPNVHDGIECSRRDDMVSLGYVLLYFCRGSLPWQKLGAATKEETFIRIGEKKRDILTETLCHGLPKEFLEYLDYTLSLPFDETPDYCYLRRIFQSLFQREFQFDHIFDWTVPGTAFLLWRDSDILAQPKVERISQEVLATKVDGRIFYSPATFIAKHF